MYSQHMDGSCITASRVPCCDLDGAAWQVQLIACDKAGNQQRNCWLWDFWKVMGSQLSWKVWKFGTFGKFWKVME